MSPLRNNPPQHKGGEALKTHQRDKQILKRTAQLFCWGSDKWGHVSEESVPEIYIHAVTHKHLHAPQQLQWMQFSSFCAVRSFRWPAADSQKKQKKTRTKILTLPNFLLRSALYPQVCTNALFYTHSSLISNKISVSSQQFCSKPYFVFSFWVKHLHGNAWLWCVSAHKHSSVLHTCTSSRYHSPETPQTPVTPRPKWK